MAQKWVILTAFLSGQKWLFLCHFLSCFLQHDIGPISKNGHFWSIFWAIFLENRSKSGFRRPKKHHFCVTFCVIFGAFTCFALYREIRCFDPIWPLKWGQKRVKKGWKRGDFGGSLLKKSGQKGVQKVVQKMAKFYWDKIFENSIQRGRFIGNCRPSMGSRSGYP